MTDNHQHDSEWVRCPSGALRHAAEQLDAGKTARSRRMVSRGIVTALLFVVVGIGVVSLRNRTSSASASLTCSDVAALMADFAAGNLDEDVAEQVLFHLAECDKCRRVFQQSYPDYDLRLARVDSPDRTIDRLALHEVRTASTDAPGSNRFMHKFKNVGWL